LGANVLFSLEHGALSTLVIRTFRFAAGHGRDYSQEATMTKLQENLAYIELLKIMDSVNPEAVSALVEQMAEHIASVRNRNIEVTALLNRLIVSLQQKDFADVVDVYRALYTFQLNSDTYDS
jgi:hypothetical protein